MIRYADNPNLDLSTVTTITKDIEYRRNCKYIGGKYYLMDRDCFYIEGKWCRIDSGVIIYDHEKKVWIHKDKAGTLVNGIVDIKNEEFIFGSFSENAYENVSCRTKKHGNSIAINSDVLGNHFFEDKALSVMFRTKDYPLTDIKYRKTIRNEKNFTDRGYNIEDNQADYANKVKYYNEYPHKISKKVREIAKYLGDLSFGVELEIAQGNLPDKILNRHGVVICRDGSIDGGPELVTIPTSGAKGLQNIVDLCEELKGRNKLSIACALHIHFGNVPTDKLFLSAFYVLCRKIQDEIFTMFPYYKTDHKGVKKKNYNQKLDKLGIHPLLEQDKESYEAYLRDVHIRIFNFLSEGKMSIDQLNRKTRAHPISHKWERKSR